MEHIERVDGVQTRVGEGPSWHAPTSSLWFIDILGDSIHRLGPDGALSSWRTPESPAAVLATSGDRMAVALENGFALFDPGAGEYERMAASGAHPGSRLSEGKADRSGRFIALSGDRSFRDPIGGVHSWDGQTVRTIDSGFVLGNGPSWSPDGSVFYVGDSLQDVIWRYRYAEDGTVSEKSLFYSSRHEPGFPDGSAVDEDGCLWVVLHESPMIVRLRPDGIEDRRIELPSPYISSLAFGDSDLSSLYVTSLDPRRIPGVPTSVHGTGAEERGLMYRVTGLGARGIPETPADVLPA